MCQADVHPLDWLLWQLFDVREQQDPSEVFEWLLDGKHALHSSCGVACAVPFVRQLFVFESVDSQRCFACEQVLRSSNSDIVVRLTEHPTFHVGLRMLQDWCAVDSFLCSLCGAVGQGALSRKEFTTAPRFLFVKAEKLPGLAATGPLVETDVLHLGDRYHLEAVIHHAGATAYSGHYTATVFNDEQAFLCDDDTIGNRSGVAMVVGDGYMALYQRVGAVWANQAEG
jgi:uncharacterized UBP type Zn finger protein